MSWVRLDDQYPDHPKVRAAGAICELIHVRAMCYAMRHLTDGMIPSAVVPSLLLGLEQIGIVTGGVSGLFEVGHDAHEVDWPARLVEYRLWHRRPGGYLLHDFLKYNPSRNEINKRREQASLAGQRSVESRWAKRQAIENNGHDAQQTVERLVEQPVERPVEPIRIQPKYSPAPTPTPTPKKERKDLTTKAESLRDSAVTILDFLNAKTGKTFRPFSADRRPTANLRFIVGRLRDGASVQDCKSVIARKVREWRGDPKMAEFLRPETLFNATKFESYLGEMPPEVPDA